MKSTNPRVHVWRAHEESLGKPATRNHSGAARSAQHRRVPTTRGEARSDAAPWVAVPPRVLAARRSAHVVARQRPRPPARSRPRISRGDVGHPRSKGIRPQGTKMNDTRRTARWHTWLLLGISSAIPGFLWAQGDAAGMPENA